MNEQMIKLIDVRFTRLIDQKDKDLVELLRLWYEKNQDRLVVQIFMDDNLESCIIQHAKISSINL